MRREAGVDVIALLAIVGSLALGEYLAGAVIALMLTTGQALESFAERRRRSRARRSCSTARRSGCARYEDGRLEERPIGDVVVGDC